LKSSRRSSSTWPRGRASPPPTWARGIDVNGNDPDPARLTDQFAALCALCAGHGLGVGIEFMMSTQVKTLADALALIERRSGACLAYRAVAQSPEANRGRQRQPGRPGPSGTEASLLQLTIVPFSP